MKWHIAHKHEIPTAFGTLGKDYEAKTISLQEDNAQLKQKLDEIERELEETKTALMQEKGEKLKEGAEIVKLNNDIHKAALAIVARDYILKQRLNIEMPNPFE